MEALDTRKMETDENSSGALGAGEHGGGSHQLQSPGSNPPTLMLAERYIAKYAAKEVLVLEIGVRSGGVWKVGVTGTLKLSGRWN